MKKLLVLALSVVLVLSFAAVSMAAVTVGGELNFGYKLDNVVSGAVADSADFGDAKITATAVISDEFTAFAAFKAGDVSVVATGVDEAWGKFTESFGTVQVGFWGQNVKDNLDILNPLGADIKPNEAIKATFTVADGVTVMGYLARPEMNVSAGVDGNGNIMGFSVAYATDAYGADLYYFSASEDGFLLSNNSIMAVNGFYNVNAAAKAYLNYTTITPVAGDDTTLGYVGFSFDSADVPYYARVEYQFEAPDANDSGAMGFRLGYKINSAAKLQYDSCDTGVSGTDTDKTSALKLQINF